MIFLHINPTKRDTILFNKYVNSGKQIFVLFYMEGCGPCNATRPEWEKIDDLLKIKYAHNNNIVIADVDQQFLSEIKNISGISGFPTMRYIAQRGKISEEYEKSSVSEKNRSIDSFIEWIESKIKPYHLEHSKHRYTHRPIHSRRRSRPVRHKGRGIIGGGKWSQKYRNSINCKIPKGFSQRQFCRAKMIKTRKNL